MEQSNEAEIKLKNIDNRTVIEVQEKHIILSQVKTFIETFFTNCVIEEVRIFAGKRLIVDANLTRDLWHGRNLIILANEINVSSPAIWDVSGKDNDHVYTSNAGTSPDGIGKDGNDGFPGESGGNVLVMSNTIENPERLTIVSNGGNGSNGQDGGDGKDGTDGKGISRVNLEGKFLPCTKCSCMLGVENLKKLMKSIMTSAKIVKHEELIDDTAKRVYTKDVANHHFDMYHTYLFYAVGTTCEGYEFKCGFESSFKQYYAFVKGAPGQPGKSGGKYGMGGQGGFPGEIICMRLDDGGYFDIKTRKYGGIDGDDGEGGFYGAYGKNGWDMGCAYLGHSFPIFYGIDEKSKLKITYYDKDAPNRVRCLRNYHERTYRYVEIEESTDEHQPIEEFKERSNTRARTDRQHHSKVVGKKSIVKKSMLSGFYEYLNHIEHERLQLERQRFEEEKKSRLARLEIEQKQIRLEQERNTEQEQFLAQEKVVKEKQCLEQEQNTKENKRLEEERLARERHRLEEERNIREKNQFEQQRLANEKQRLDQERVVREKQRLEQLRVTQENQRLEQERIAAERQQLEQEIIAKENKLQKQMKIAREREQLALIQAQTCEQELEQLEIEQEKQRIAQEQIKIKIERRKQQMAQEKERAELQQIEQEKLQVQKQFEEKEHRLKQHLIEQGEHRLAQQRTEEEHKQMTQLIEEEQQRLDEQFKEKQSQQLFQRTIYEEKHKTAQQQIAEVKQRLEEQQREIEEKQLEEQSLQYIENNLLEQDITTRCSILNRIQNPIITRRVNFAYDTDDDIQNFFNTLGNMVEDTCNEEMFGENLVDNLAKSSNIDDWLKLRFRLVNMYQLMRLLQMFELLKSSYHNVSDTDCTTKIQSVEEILIIKYKLIMLRETQQQPDLLPSYTANENGILKTAKLIGKYLEETEERDNSLSHPRLGTFKQYIFENSPEQRANLKAFTDGEFQNCSHAIKCAIETFVLEIDSTKIENECVKQYYDKYNSYLKHQRRNFDTITETLAEELQKPQHLEILYLWNESVDDDASLETLEEMIGKHETLSSLFDNFKHEENSKYDWGECSADEQIQELVRINIEHEGIRSKTCRVLLAYLYDVNIRVYTRNEDNEIVLLENHNPESNTATHILMKVDEFIQLQINEAYHQLEEERLHYDRVYKRVLNKVANLQTIQDVKDYFDRKIYDRNDFSIEKEFNGMDGKTAVEKIVDFFAAEEKDIIFHRLKNISPKYTGQHGVFEYILQRFSFEGRHVSCNELCFMINFILEHSVEKRQERYTFSWIISACNQCNWIDELLLLQLENSFKRKIMEKLIWREYMSKIVNKSVLLVFAAHLYRHPCSPECVGNILYFLSSVPIETICLDQLDQLKLTEWPYVLKDIYWTHKLKSFLNWGDEQDKISIASFLILSIENTYDDMLLNMLFNSLEVKSSDLKATELITVLTYYNTQKWILCDKDLKKLKQKSLKEWFEFMNEKYQIKSDELEGSQIVKAIEINKNTTANVINHLHNVETSVKKISTNERLFGTKSVSTFTDTDINKWNKQFKSKKQTPGPDVYEEMLAVIDRAIELKKGFRLRDTQRLTVLALLVNDKKTLAQVSTGEGKSLIVVSIAIIKGLLGEKVDIITSSSVLAQRDATINSNIYKLFDLHASHNCSENIEERKEAYSSNQIMYGDLVNFQRDYLLDRFFRKHVLGDRSFQNVIVDEVDSMLLDKGNNMLYLSNDIAGMDKLEAVYVYIWQMVNIVTDRFPQEFHIKEIKRAVLSDMYPSIEKQDIQGLDNALGKSNVTLLWERLVMSGIISDSGRLLTEDISSEKLDTPVLIRQARSGRKHFINSCSSSMDVSYLLKA